MNKNEHKYESLTAVQLEELLSNFLVDSWSFSKIAQFSRNEKSFEMSYIYGYKHKSSASSVAGSAYHYALDLYFEALKDDGEPLGISALEVASFEYIDSISDDQWKIQKTTPTAAECKKKATDDIVKLLNNFFSEESTYLDDIKEILFVELYFDEFMTVNGVDIPLPCHGKIDLVYRSKDDKIIVLDHKTVRSFSSEEEIKMTIGKQAITYVIGIEKKTDLKVDEVRFVQNKISKNKDGSPQLNAFSVDLDKDTRRLYEVLLYEPLKRMLEAVSNPDYIYLINDNDNFIDRAALYEFWAKTLIAEVDEFDIKESKKELISKRMKKIRDASLASVNPKLIKEFKKNAAEFIKYDLTTSNMKKEEKIEHVLRSFGKLVKVHKKIEGYSNDSYLLSVSAGIKITSIHSHKLDIANVLEVPNVRVSNALVMHEGKSYLSVEVAKQSDRILHYDASVRDGYKIPIGEDNFGNVISWDLDNHSTPHVLICGGTGSGKSVCIKVILNHAMNAGVTDIVIFDPKFEFTEYSGSAKIYNEIEDIEEQMRVLVDRMNEGIKSGKTSKTLVIFDEFADAVDSSKKGRELDIKEALGSGKLITIGREKSLEENLKRLLQKGRSSGFRIVAATQRASVKVISGDAKVNLPVQICFKVQKEVDSKVVLDEAGAESLAGRGDGLIRSPEFPDLVRFQGYFKS